MDTTDETDGRVRRDRRGLVHAVYQGETIVRDTVTAVRQALRRRVRQTKELCLVEIRDEQEQVVAHAVE